MTTFEDICVHCPSGQACARWGYCNAEAMREGESAPDARPKQADDAAAPGVASQEQQTITLINDTTP